MTSGFSTWQGRIRKATSFPGDDAPIGPVTGRDYAVNNANHYADIFGQVRARWAAQAGGYIVATNTANLSWKPIWVAERFPIALRPDGSSYRVRVRINGSAENASFKVGFAVSLSTPDPASIHSVYPGSAATDAVWSAGTNITATSAAYLAGASLGSSAWTTMIAMTATEAAACVRSTSTIVDVAGSRISVTQAMAALVFWAYVEDTAHQARLYAVDGEEWPG